MRAVGVALEDRATIGSWPAWETQRARRGPGTMRSISAISTWICVSAATSRREREASATAMWKRASASRKAANSPTALSAAAAASVDWHGARPASARSAASAGGLARDRAPPVGQLAQRARVGGLARRARAPPGVLAHERAAGAAAARLDEAGVAQDLQRLAQRHRSHAELGRELELARQPLAGREHARADRLAEAAHDLLDGALGLEWRERDVASGERAGHLNTITSR